LRTQEISQEQLLQAAHTAALVPLTYAQQGSSLALAALAGARQFVELQHYPLRDASDAKSGTRFYYHAHRRDAPEHGHFHLFAYGPDGRSDFMHLAALSLDHQGQPTQWFTTNQWVTAERWAPADEVIAALDRFRVETKGRLAPVARWLTAMVQLFQPQLHELLHERDWVMSRHMARCSKEQAQEAVFSDRQIDVLSTTSAQLAPRIQQLGV
jgi:hypothetical protein